MTKANKDSNTKLPSGKNVSATGNAALVGNPTKTEKLPPAERYAERMRLNGITPLSDISTNGQVQIFQSDGKTCGSVLSINDSAAVGIFGYLASEEDPFKWAVKAKNESQASITAQVEIELRKRFNQAKLNFAKTSYDEAAAEDVNVDMTEPVDPSDTESSNEPKEEKYETAVSRLSALSDYYYDLARKETAKLFGIRVSTLDKAVANERSQINTLKIMGPRLLSDVYEIVTSLDVQQIGTARIISELCAGNSKIWSVFNRGDQIDTKALAHILNIYGVSSRDIRFGDAVLKGYSSASIVAAYTRYITPTPAVQPLQDSSSE